MDPTEPQAKPLNLCDLWTALCRGQYRISESGVHDEAFLILDDAAPRRENCALDAQNLGVLVRVLLGESQQAIAIDMKRSCSTIALQCSICLRAMGNEHRVSRAPFLLAMAAHAAAGVPLEPLTVMQQSTLSGQRVLVRAPIRSRFYRSVLTFAEREVVRLLLSGCSHTQIAAARITSTRTVANQLSSVFRKYRVSGRTELVSKIIRTSCLQ